MTPAEEQQLTFAARTNAVVRKLVVERDDLRDENARLRAALSDAVTIAQSRARCAANQHRLIELQKLVVAR